MSDEPRMEAGPAPFVTFAGAGFGTIQIERVGGSELAPASVSGRRYLRDNLPGIYSEGDFASPGRARRGGGSGAWARS